MITKNLINLSTFFPSKNLHLDTLVSWSMFFQDAATPQMEKLEELHNNIMFYLAIIMFVVTCTILIIYCVVYKYIIFVKPLKQITIYLMEIADILNPDETPKPTGKDDNKPNKTLKPSQIMVEKQKNKKVKSIRVWEPYWPSNPRDVNSRERPDLNKRYFRWKTITPPNSVIVFPNSNTLLFPLSPGYTLQPVKMRSRGPLCVDAGSTVFLPTDPEQPNAAHLPTVWTASRFSSLGESMIDTIGGKPNF